MAVAQTQEIKNAIKAEKTRMGHTVGGAFQTVASRYNEMHSDGAAWNERWLNALFVNATKAMGLAELSKLPEQERQEAALKAIDTSLLTNNRSYNYNWLHTDPDMSRHRFNEWDPKETDATLKALADAYRPGDKKYPSLGLTPTQQSTGLPAPAEVKQIAFEPPRALLTYLGNLQKDGTYDRALSVALVTQRDLRASVDRVTDPKTGIRQLLEDIKVNAVKVIGHVSDTRDETLQMVITHLGGENRSISKALSESYLAVQAELQEYEEQKRLGQSETQSAKQIADLTARLQEDKKRSTKTIAEGDKKAITFAEPPLLKYEPSTSMAIRQYTHAPTDTATTVTTVLQRYFEDGKGSYLTGADGSRIPDTSGGATVEFVDDSTPITASTFSARPHTFSSADLHPSAIVPGYTPYHGPILADLVTQWSSLVSVDELRNDELYSDFVSHLDQMGLYDKERDVTDTDLVFDLISRTLKEAEIPVARYGSGDPKARVRWEIVPAMQLCLAVHDRQENRGFRPLRTTGGLDVEFAALCTLMVTTYMSVLAEINQPIGEAYWDNAELKASTYQKDYTLLVATNMLWTRATKEKLDMNVRDFYRSMNYRLANKLTRAVLIWANRKHFDHALTVLTTRLSDPKTQVAEKLPTNLREMLIDLTSIDVRCAEFTAVLDAAATQSELDDAGQGVTDTTTSFFRFVELDIATSIAYARIIELLYDLPGTESLAEAFVPGLSEVYQRLDGMSNESDDVQKLVLLSDEYRKCRTRMKEYTV